MYLDKKNYQSFKFLVLTPKIYVLSTYTTFPFSRILAETLIFFFHWSINTYVCNLQL